MRRVGKIVLEYTKEELAALLQGAITSAEKVSIEDVHYENEKFIFNCVEGLNNIPSAQQASKIDIVKLLTNKTSKTRQFGLKKAIKACLANNVKCSIEKLVAELNLKGFKGDAKYFKNYFSSNAMKDTIKEVDPGIYQLTK